ncbi:MAG TPA: proline racemase family protein [Vicinamibacterales bacterium]
MIRIETIDAHTAGEPLRLILKGFPAVEGGTVLEQREFVREHYDHLRRALMLEPRGHADMYGALLTPPEHPGSHAGVLFMHNEGFSTMCGHGIIAVATIAIERGLIDVPVNADGTARLVLDSPAGPIEATAYVGPGISRAEYVGPGFSRAEDVGPGFSRARVTSVRFRNVPSFVLHPALSIQVGTRHVRVDVAFGGAFYAIVDSEAVGVPITPARLPDLRRIGMEIKHAVEKAVTVEHPLEPQLQGIYGTIFTGPPSDEGADLRNVTIFADAEVDRSPCGTGTAAVMAVLHAMGILTEGDQVFTHESIVGSTFRGRVVGTTTLSTANSQGAKSQEVNSQGAQSQGEPIDAIVPEIEGEAYITGEHTFIIDERDPFREGFRL